MEQNTRVNQFPVIDSILAPAPLATFVKELYQMEGEVTAKILKRGINHTYLVDNAGLYYVWRIYCLNWRSIKEIQEELSLLVALKEQGVSVSYPINAVDGSIIQEIQAPEGLRYAVLFSFAPGEKIRNFTTNNAYRLGEIVGEFHQFTQNKHIDRISYSATTLLHKPYQYALKYLSPELVDMVYIQEASSMLTGLFAEANLQELRQGIVHLDMWYDNMNVDSTGGITIFDFDFCGNGWLVLDLAYTAMQLFQTTPDAIQAREKIEAFFKGYQTVCIISEEEFRLLPYVGLSIWIFYLGVQSQRFDDWSNLFLSPNYLERYMGMAKNWMKFNGIEV